MAGCDSGSSSSSSSVPPKPSGQSVAVLATVQPLADLAERVGGQWVAAEWVIESGQRPEELETTPDLRQRANKAALVITSGPWDTWAVAELSPEARSTRVIEPDHMGMARGADRSSYLWLDPAVMREMVETLRVRLTVIDPAHDADYRSAAKAYTGEVDAVDEAWRVALAGQRGRKLLVVRPVWGALCARYGLRQVAPVGAVEEKLSSDDLKELARAGKEAGCKWVVVDLTTTAGVRQRIEEKTGLATMTLDAMGSSAADGRNTWQKVMKYNLEQVRKAIE
ncbi:MAG TPA: metal ABC transporter substrate-binding protein [Tepidisphaeraceae bacterium]